MADDYSPIYCGDLASPLSVQFLHKDGTAHDLTGATISMKMLSMDGAATKTCAGTWTIDDATNGQAHYGYASTDVDTAGNWQLYIKIVNDDGQIHADPKVLSIFPVP
jgi:hypothetical protein